MKFPTIFRYGKKIFYMKIIFYSSGHNFEDFRFMYDKLLSIYRIDHFTFYIRIK